MSYGLILVLLIRDYRLLPRATTKDDYPSIFHREIVGMKTSKSLKK